MKIITVQLILKLFTINFQQYLTLQENIMDFQPTLLLLCGSMGKKTADSMQFWTVDEFNAFISAVEDKPVSKAAFEILFWTGIRSGELLALTLNDFDFEAETVNIDKNYARLGDEDLILEPKTPKSKRIITIPTFLCDIVKDYASKLYDYEPDERLFTITKHYLHHEMDRGCKKSKVKRIRIHDLRHSHVSLSKGYFWDSLSDCLR